MGLGFPVLLGAVAAEDSSSILNSIFLSSVISPAAKHVQLVRDLTSGIQPNWDKSTTI
jgi:hypothetical protein